MLNNIEHLLNKMQFISKSQNEKICLVGPVQLPVKVDNYEETFQWYTWLTVDASYTKEEILLKLPKLNLAASQQSSVLVYGDFQNDEETLIRLHSICHTGDIFGSKRCDCGFQLREAMKKIIDHGSGAIFYLANHEGRGIGLFSKAFAYLLQEQGLDTVDANLALGFEDDIRSYEEAISVLQSLRKKPITLITNNPKKLEALKKYGLSANHHIPLWGGETESNQFYLETKIKKAGHIAMAKIDK